MRKKNGFCLRLSLFCQTISFWQGILILKLCFCGWVWVTLDEFLTSASACDKLFQTELCNPLTRNLNITRLRAAKFQRVYRIRFETAFLSSPMYNNQQCLSEHVYALVNWLQMTKQTYYKNFFASSSYEFGLIIFVCLFQC